MCIRDRYLDEDKIAEEAQYDGLYAVCTDLLDDEVGDILKVSEGRWQIEECFRIMKTDFSARPVYLREENRIKACLLYTSKAFMGYASRNTTEQGKRRVGVFEIGTFFRNLTGYKKAPKEDKDWLSVSQESLRSAVCLLYTSSGISDRR